MRATLQARRRLHLLWSAGAGFVLAVVLLDIARRVAPPPAPRAGALAPDAEYACLPACLTMCAA